MKTLVYLLAMLISSAISSSTEGEKERKNCDMQPTPEKCHKLSENILNDNFKLDECNPFIYREKVS
ncbi:hypothetical protein [Robertkochia flava]|uniref:hypothetical protein n=1 Tax=Robertkochia flava TaxID=3447986 RepID=UPI001CCC2FB2|nr:hypothetical protein [Robertkochia marina]